MHPPELSLREKSRYIKAYYYIWGLLCLQESAWPERLSHLPLRYMYYVDELSRVSSYLYLSCIKISSGVSLHATLDHSSLFL